MIANPIERDFSDKYSIKFRISIQLEKFVFGREMRTFALLHFKGELSSAIVIENRENE